MRAVVTGGCGFIGSHLVEALVRDGWEVTVVDSLVTSPLPLPDLRSEWSVPVKVIPAAIREIPAPVADVFFHLASPVGPVGVLARSGHIASEVIADAATVADWATASDAVLVDVSTSELYGPQEGACVETLARVTPAGHSARMEYAVAKLAAETMLLNRPVDVRVVRPFNVTGPRQSSKGGFVLPRFVSQALRSDPITVYQPGTQLRAFTHVADIVSGLILAATKSHPGAVYNLGNPDNLTTIADLATKVVEATSSHSPLETVDPQALWGPGFREAADKWPDARKAKRELGWTPKYGLEQTICDVVAYMSPADRLERLGA